MCPINTPRFKLLSVSDKDSVTGEGGEEGERQGGAKQSNTLFVALQ